MGRHKRVVGLALRTRPPTDEERISEIIEVFKECNQELTPELISQQFYYETKRVPYAKLVKEALHEQ